VPVPRRFDRRPPERDQTRINDRIRVPEVRLVGDDGKQIGVVKTAEALAYAQERDLDLVEVAPEARPPVCRALDYSKYKYEQAQKIKQARKHQQQITIREIKFRPKIAQNDYDTKKGHVRRFLLGKDRVKVTIMFRGREVTHPERGTALLDKLATELAEVAVVEQTPLQDGRNMTMMLGPSKGVIAGEVAGSKPPVPVPEPEPEREAETAPETEAETEAGTAPETEAEAELETEAASEADGGGADSVGNGHQNGATDSASPTPSDAAA
jgi:translation initiation factor IF-3